MLDLAAVLYKSGLHIAAKFMAVCSVRIRDAAIILHAYQNCACNMGTTVV